MRLKAQASPGFCGELTIFSPPSLGLSVGRHLDFLKDPTLILLVLMLGTLTQIRLANNGHLEVLGQEVSSSLKLLLLFNILQYLFSRPFVSRLVNSA